MEQKVEAMLDEHGIFYAKSETWFDSEKLYEVKIEAQEKEQLKLSCSSCIILRISQCFLRPALHKKYGLS